VDVRHRDRRIEPGRVLECLPDPRVQDLITSLKPLAQADAPVRASQSRSVENAHL
jgi:hypothetical protein